MKDRYLFKAIDVQLKKVTEANGRVTLKLFANVPA